MATVRVNQNGKAPSGLKVGDKVLYGKYAGTEIEIEGEKLMIMKQSDVLATL